MNTPITCRKSRRAIQEALDRGNPFSPAEREQLTRFLPEEVQAHLQRCPECRDYLRSLGTYAAALRSQLDKSLRDYPDPDFAAVLPGAGKIEHDRRTPSPRASSRAGIVAAFRRFGNRLFGPGGKPAAPLRWAAIAAAVLLVVSPIGFRIYSVSATRRAVRQQIDRVVERIYTDPLFPGIESALLRTQPDISDYVEDLGRAIDLWLEDTASASFLN